LAKPLAAAAPLIPRAIVGASKAEMVVSFMIVGLRIKVEGL
jgi:hypothetical protein